MANILVKQVMGKSVCTPDREHADKCLVTLTTGQHHEPSVAFLLEGRVFGMTLISYDFLGCEVFPLAYSDYATAKMKMLFNTQSIYLC